MVSLETEVARLKALQSLGSHATGAGPSTADRDILLSVPQFEDIEQFEEFAQSLFDEEKKKQVVR